MVQTQWKVVRISLILVSLSFGVISFLLPIYSKAVGLSATEIGGMFSIFSLMLLIIKPLMGRWIDKVGWKRFFVAAMVVYAVAFYLLAGATSSWVLYGARMVHGIGAAFLGIAIYNMAVAISDENAVGRQLGKVQSAQSTGIMIGAVLCFIIVGNVDFLKGWYRLFIIFSVMSLIGALLISLGIKEDMKMTTSKENLKLNIKYSKDVLGLVFITFILSLSSSMLSPILMVYLQDVFTTDLLWLSVAFIPSCIIYSVLGGRLGYLGDRYGYIKMMILGISINSIIAFSIPSTQHLIVLGALWCADAVGDLIEGTSRSAFLSKIVGQERRGEVYGICGAAGSLGAVIGPFLGGVLYDKISVRAPFYTNGLGLLIACALILLIFGTNKYNKTMETKECA